MKITRSELREKIMIILYQIEFYKQKKMEFDIDSIINENINIKNKYVSEMVYGVLENEDKLIEIINKYLKNWDIKRLGITDASILKLSSYELLYMDTPKIVCINEAIELSKKYSDDKVVKMINAVLDAILDNEE